MTISSLGWIGLGAMGLPLCGHLLRDGHTLRVHDLQPARVEQAVAAGALAAGSAAAVASHSDVIFSMVLDDDALRAVIDASARHTVPGSLWIDMSTVSPQASAQVAALLAERGVAYLRAPVSGSPRLAADGSLSVYTSGRLQDHERALPLLQQLSSRQSYVGEAEAARVVKLAINLMVAGSTVLIGEALRLGTAAGVERGVLFDAIADSIVGSRHYSSRAQAFKTQVYSDQGPVSLLAKDLDLALALTRGSAPGLSLPITALVRETVTEMVADGRAQVEVTALADYPRLRPARASTPPSGASS
jgi:3-hydroxyisobutyrate dehydrogenase